MGLKIQSPTTDDQQGSVPLEIFVDGSFELPPFAEVRRRIWESHFSMVMPLDRGMHRFGEQHKSFSLASTVGVSGIAFLYALLSQVEPLTKVGLWQWLGKKVPDNDGGFHKRASRARFAFSKIQRQAGPLFESCKVFDRCGRAQSAYKVRPGVTTIVVVGVDADYRGARVPLARLMQPPE